jgi:hypothetical protein
VQDREQAARIALDYLDQAGIEKPWLIVYDSICGVALRCHHFQPLCGEAFRVLTCAMATSSTTASSSTASAGGQEQ